jgi:succinyl-diaminopimelate desuccinylase
MSITVNSGAQAAVDSFMGEHREEMLTLCRDLVSARSPNPPGRTVEAAAVIQAFLGRHGVDCEIMARVEDKPNLLCALNSGTGRHLGFNGHLDTIPAGDSADWSVPLYGVTEKDRRLYGLGIGNMKAGVAALVMTVVFLAARRELWSGRLSFSAVADETVFGDDGAGWLLSKRPDLVGDALICGEGPGNMDLAIAEKGLLWVEVDASAPTGQGMLARAGSSAVSKLAAAVVAIDAMNDIVAEPPEDVASLRGTSGEPGLRLSVNTGTISGGTFVSQTATQATAQADFRIPPGLTIDAIDKAIEERCAGIADLKVRHIKGWNPNWSAPNEDIAVAVREASNAVRGRAPRDVVRLPASDANRWRARGVPAVCYGPQPLLASGVDDYVERQDIIDCARIYALSALAYLGA